MAEKVKVTIKGQVYEYEKGTSFLEIAKDFQKDYKEDMGIFIDLEHDEKEVITDKEIKINYDISEYENIVQDNEKVDMICEQREKINILEKTVKHLKYDDISIFNLYYYSSMKISEISKALNISDFNVKMRLHRIRKKIKKEFSKGGYSDDK